MAIWQQVLAAYNTIFHQYKDFICSQNKQRFIFLRIKRLRFTMEMKYDFLEVRTESLNIIWQFHLAKN
jgi:hypothetical protein